MEKFISNRRRNDLRRFENSPLFDDMFELVWSGNYGEIIPNEIRNGSKLGYTIKLEAHIDMDLSEDDEDSPFFVDDYIINLDKMMTLFQLYGAKFLLKVTRGREVKYFNVTISCMGYSRELNVGIIINRDNLIEIFNDNKKDIFLGAYSYKEDPEVLYVRNIDILNFSYYKLRKELL